MFSWSITARCAYSAVVLVAASGLALAQPAQRTATAIALPRTADGEPNFQGIWRTTSRAAYDLQDHAAKYGMPAGKGVVVGGEIPYLPAALASKRANLANRQSADPLGKCYLPGVPRIMYLDLPFQIFQTPGHVAMTFEWSSVHRLIYTNGKPPLHAGVESWMGDSRGRWAGDTLVVEVKGQNGNTWFDMAGNHHSEAMRVTERYTLLNADTIQYEATIDDAKTFTKPWKISLAFARQKDMVRVLEYQCQAELEEANGAFERGQRTWYPLSGVTAASAVPATMPPGGTLPPVKAATNVRRTADGKPDFSGYFQSNGGGANYGLEKHASDFLTPGGRGVVIDPPDGLLPYQPWARAERVERELPHRGYDDPTAHCFVAGVPRSMYTPSPIQILQPPGFVVILFERMSWRIIPMDTAREKRTHLPDNVRLWQGDSIGHWEGDTLVIETTNLNGKTWLNEVGDVVSHAERVIERFIPTADGKFTYRATVTDPIVYSKPWTIEIPMNGEVEELLEGACHEDNGDLEHLKDVRDEYRAQQKKGK